MIWKNLESLDKRVFFGIAGAMGCVASALFFGEIALALLVPKAPEKKVPPPTQVDVLFVLDTTASMGAQIRGVQNGIINFAQELSKRNLDARVGLIDFRDEDADRPAQALKFPEGTFTKDISTFQKEVGGLSANGGGDNPESSLDALELSVKQPFRPEATKVILMITDAEPKTLKTAQGSGKSLEASIEETAKSLKAAGISQFHLVCNPIHNDLYYQKIQKLVPGEFFNLAESSRGESGFDRALPAIGTRIAEITIASQQGLVTKSEVADKDRGQLMLATAVWTGLLAPGVGLALIAAQNFYLRRPFLSKPEAIQGLSASMVAGILAGYVGQLIELQFGNNWSVIKFLGRLSGWVLLGAIVGVGMAFFVKNLSRQRALIGGAAGGLIGFLGFSIASAILGLFVGRMLGAAILGLCIGVMIAWVEYAYRRYYLEVTFGPGERRNVNLGDAPVSIGSNSKVCAVWLPQAMPIDCTFLLRDQTLQFTDASTGQMEVVTPGFHRRIDTVDIAVRAANESEANATNPLPTPPSMPAPQVGSWKKPPPEPSPPKIPAFASFEPEPQPNLDVGTTTIPSNPRPSAVSSSEADTCPNGCGIPVKGPKGQRYCMGCGDKF